MLRHICPLSCELADCRGHPGEIDAAHERERVLVAKSGASAANFIDEAAHAERDWGRVGLPIPTAISVFGTDPIVRRTLDPEERNPHWFEHERGGHFPSLEVPDLLLDDLRTFFRSVRT
jgi:hypothetical protein